MKTILAFVFIFVAYCVGANESYEIAKAAERERKNLHEGRIYSKRCERQGKRVLATKTDNKEWKVQCVTAEAKWPDVEKR